jgi:hypothetical protein
VSLPTPVSLILARVSFVNVWLIGFGNRDDDSYKIEDEQAAVGRLSSMSLMAAVTASGKTPFILSICLLSSLQCHSKTAYNALL